MRKNLLRCPGARRGTRIPNGYCDGVLAMHGFSPLAESTI